MARVMDAGALRKALQSEGVLLEDIRFEHTAQHLIDICDRLDISPETLADRWLIYSQTQNIDIDEAISFGYAKAFAASLHLDMQNRQATGMVRGRKPVVGLVKKRKAATSVGALAGMQGMLAMAGIKQEPMASPRAGAGVEPELLASPDGAGMHGSPSFSPPHDPAGGMSVGDNAYSSRHQRRKIEFQFPAASAVKKEDGSVPVPSPAYVAKAAAGAQAPGLEDRPSDGTGLTYMYQKTADVCRALRQRLEAQARRMLSEGAEAALDVELAATQEEVTIVGRVCVEKGASKLTKTAVQVEVASGERARLDMGGVEGGYTLFPGQVVAVTGVIIKDTNDGSMTIKATVVQTAPHAEHDSTEPSVKREVGAGGVRALVAAGPYTTAKSLKYVPLADLLEVAADEQPDLLVLCGPFVDEKAFNAPSKPVPMHHSFEDIFQQCVLHPVHAFAERCPATRVVMVPSLRDVHAHFVFPQPALAPARAAIARSRNVDLLQNPATFSCKGVEFGVSTAEVLKSMSGAVVIDAVDRAKCKGAGTRMAHLAQMCVDQRSFMPLMPAPTDIPLDVSSEARVKCIEMPRAPDVLLLPSDLKFMAKPCTGNASCHVVNPGRLCKGMSAGTFARLHITPSQASGAKEQESKIDIVRI